MYAHAERLQIVANGSTWFQMKRGGTKAKRWRERMSSVADDRSVVPMIGAHRRKWDTQGRQPLLVGLTG